MQNLLSERKIIEPNPTKEPIREILKNNFLLYFSIEVVGSTKMLKISFDITEWTLNITF